MSTVSIIEVILPDGVLGLAEGYARMLQYKTSRMLMLDSAMKDPLLSRSFSLDVHDLPRAV